MAHQPGFCLSVSQGQRESSHSPSIEMLQPVEEQKLEDPQVSGEPGMKVTGSTGTSHSSRQGWQEGGRNSFPTPGRSECSALAPTILL